MTTEESPPPPLPGESPQAYHRRMTAGYGNPIPERLPYPTANVTITPNSTIKLTLVKAGAALVGVAMLVWSARGFYEGIQESIRQLDQRVSEVAKAVQSTDPAHIRDQCREIVRHEMRGLVMECPRATRRGEAVSECKIVRPVALRQDEP